MCPRIHRNRLRIPISMRVEGHLSDCALLKRSDPHELHTSTFPSYCLSEHDLDQE